MGRHALAGFALALSLVSFNVVGHAQSSSPATDNTQTLLHILDYVGVDYGGAADNGKIVNASEFEEQQGFARQIPEMMKALPANPQQAKLIAEAKQLAAQINAKAKATDVAAAAGQLKWDVINTYNVRVTPQHAPNLDVAPTLFRDNCASCHGLEGFGDGESAKSLDPVPANFHNTERMRQRSIYGLYNTITLGVNGTAMAPHPELTEDDRWALAFYVASFDTDAATRARGATLWKNAGNHAPYATIDAVTTLSPEEMQTRFGDDAAATQAFLFSQPSAWNENAPSPIDFALSTIAASANAYRNGDRAQAQQLAVQAYLEGFELVENSLQNVDADLMRDTEHQMMALRELMRNAGSVEAVDQQTARIVDLLKQSKDRLSSTSLSSGATFFSALLILLREGIEALLVVAAIVAFLSKAGRRDALPYVHVGWISAVVLGVATWAIATWAIDISGANREITEGVTGLIAAAMLIYVGYWLHSKASASAWQNFIKEKIGVALAQRTLWAMALISFFAVYREMFETVLFYQALWAQTAPGSRSAVLFGVIAAVLLLAILAWAIFKYSVRLPLKPFFKFTSILLCALAVVLAGEGIAALQEAGVLTSTAIHFPSVPLLGIFPTLQGVATQIVVLLIIIAAFRFSARAAK